MRVTSFSLRSFSFICLLILWAMMATSCQQTIQRDFKSYKKKIVVHSQNAEGDSAAVTLTESGTYYGYIEQKFDLNFLQNAVVSITSDGITDVLSPAIRYDTLPYYDPNQNDSVKVYYYKGHTALQKGKTYELTVTHNNRTVTSSMRIPERASIAYFKTIKVENTDPFAPSGNHYELQMAIKDLPGKSYYKLRGLIVTPVVDSWSQDTTYLYNTFSNNIINDQYVEEGGLIKVNTYLADENFILFNAPCTLMYVLETLDQPSGEFWESIMMQQGTEGALFTEPYILRSNIENGLGIFGGISRTDTIIETFVIPR